MAGRGRKKYYAVRVGFKPGLYTEWSEAEKQVTGYNGAEYCSFKLKREADKYLKTKKKKEQQKTDAQNNTQSDQRQDNDENSVNADEIPEETNGTQQQEDERDFIVMEEYSYNQELEEKLIKFMEWF